MGYFSRRMKHLLAASFIGLVIVTNSNANATIDSEIWQNYIFYLGAGIKNTKYVLSKDFTSKIENPPNNGSVAPKALSVTLPILGLRIYDRYGCEFGYSIYRNFKFSGAQAGKVRLRNYFLDLMGYLPVARHIELLAGAGLGRMQITETSNLQAIGNGTSYNKFGLRAKAGMQYVVDLNWHIRGLLGYQRVGDQDGKQSVKNVRSVDLEVVYLF